MAVPSPGSGWGRAGRQGIQFGLSTYLRELAANEAKRVRRERIRTQSRAVGDYLAASPEGRAFYEEAVQKRL